MNILVTGASGFVGQALCKYITQKDEICLIVGTSRSKNELHHCHKSIILSLDTIKLTSQAALVKHFKNIDVVIHLAGRAHVMKDTESDIEEAYYKANVEYTCKLAEVAVQSGVKRFVFLSSIKVNGELTNYPFTFGDIPSPKDSYGRSKLAAEKKLLEIAKNTSLEVSIIRPSLIYGEGVKGNLLSLQKLLKKRLPLPFGSVKNRRSLCSLTSLCNLIWLCSIRQEAANQVFLAADARPISTIELVDALAHGLGMKANLIKLPHFILKFLGFCLGKKGQMERILGNLEVDTSYTTETLNWVPEQDTRTALTKLALLTK
ncbi:NAD-dependent epimerase/dehydratase family protein [Zooshikella ganghwensis]|uniref:NAD-dependent epimerase/dehydratase family protein n=1 Tax=Zooshikella ganghwensis TaxID=202772 RepID=A0A4P9VIX0_9GAMM|nr:NAD-dependent epimerase/dehydratase family protein [Zooshikella ganghwensis]RDH43185.1 NAD-dependent epimerase/dehydratase family protein [Zooshikella ganghwensis]